MNAKTKSTFAQASRQRGAVLFVALVFLLLITILALTASGTSVLEERMTGGMRSSQLALMGAETALREGELMARTMAEQSLGSAALNFCDAGGTPPCLYRADGGVVNPAVALFKKSTDSCANAALCANATSVSATKVPTSSLARAPAYVIEWLGYLADSYPQSGVMGGSGQRQSQQACDGSAGPKIGLFRVTGRSSGGNDATVRVAESVFSAFVTCAYN